jgi:hypothetical protein
MFGAAKQETGSRLAGRVSATIAATALLISGSADLRAQKEATEDVKVGYGPPINSDIRIRRALALLPTIPPVAIEVLDARTLPSVLQTDVHGACAFIMKGVSRINVLSSCPSFQEAANSPLSAMQLAAVLQHEMAHLNGANEWQARMVELRAFRELLQRAPRSELVPGMQYAARIEVAAAAAKKEVGKGHTAPASSR